MIRFAMAATVSMLVLMSGCMSEPLKQTDTRLNAVQAEFSIPPKELADQVKTALAAPPLQLPIVSQEKGTLTTGYRDYEGAFHIARRWKEQTRFRIEISPDWENPAGKAKLTVTEQTQQRRTSNQAWEDAPELQRHERAEAVLEQIMKNVKQ